MTYMKHRLRKFSNSDRNYNDPAYTQFRKEVFKRDGRVCQWPHCGSSKRLRVHHIRTWAEYPELRFVIGNGIVLCKECHDKIWGKEEEYETLFFSIIQRQNNDQRPKQRGKSGDTRTHDQNKSENLYQAPEKRKKRRRRKSYAGRYAIAKRKARKR